MADEITTPVEEITDNKGSQGSIGYDEYNNDPNDPSNPNMTPTTPSDDNDVVKSTSTLLIDLFDEVNKATTVTVDQMIAPALIGSSKGILNFYDEKKTYKKGDKVAYLADDGEFIVIVATKETTGTFDPRVWEEWNVIDELKRLHDDYAVLSYNEPKLRLNKVWLEIKEESIDLATAHSLGNTTTVLIYKNLIISERMPMMDAETVWGKITGAEEVTYPSSSASATNTKIS